MISICNESHHNDVTIRVRFPGNPVPESLGIWLIFHSRDSNCIPGNSREYFQCDFLYICPNSDPKIQAISEESLQKFGKDEKIFDFELKYKQKHG